jgi:hypothetical protein
MTKASWIGLADMAFGRAARLQAGSNGTNEERDSAKIQALRSAAAQIFDYFIARTQTTVPPKLPEPAEPPVRLVQRGDVWFLLIPGRAVQLQEIVQVVRGEGDDPAKIYLTLQEETPVCCYGQAGESVAALFGV